MIVIRTLILPAIISAVATVRTAEAGYLTGNDLHSKCTASDSFDAGVCAGYIAGAASVLIDSDALIPGIKTRLCVPQQQVPLGQIVDVAKLYLVKHPEKRHQEAWGLISLALRDAFPCE